VGNHTALAVITPYCTSDTLVSLQSL